jgi:hypothetical protein
MFKDFCKQIRMNVAFTLVYHPQSNGAVERADALIFEAIKKILEGEKKGNWQRSCQKQYGAITLQYRVTNFTPFWLMYRADIVLLEEVKHQNL